MLGVVAENLLENDESEAHPVEREYIEKEFEFHASKIKAKVRAYFPVFSSDNDTEKSTMKTVRQMLVNSYVVTQ